MFPEASHGRPCKGSFSLNLFLQQKETEIYKSIRNKFRENQITLQVLRYFNQKICVVTNLKVVFQLPSRNRLKHVRVIYTEFL